MPLANPVLDPRDPRVNSPVYADVIKARQVAEGLSSLDVFMKK